MDSLTHLESSSALLSEKEKDPLVLALCDPDLDHSTIDQLIAVHLEALNQENAKNKTPLDYAIKHQRSISVVQTLLSSKTDPVLGQTMMTTVAIASIDIAVCLFEKAKETCGDYGAFHLVKQRDQQRRTPLMVAISQVHLGFVKLLLQNRAETNSIDWEGNSPLIYAARMIKHADLAQAPQLSEIVSLLLKANADVGWCNEKGKNALSYAVEYQHSALCKQLKDAGARLPPVVKFDYVKTAWIWLEQPKAYSNIALEISKKLLSAIQPQDQAHQLRYQPFRGDVDEAIEMAQTRLQELKLIEIRGEDEVVVLDKPRFAKTVIDCLSHIIQEKYGS